MTADVSNIVSDETPIASPKSPELSKTHEGELDPKVFPSPSVSSEGEADTSRLDELRAIARGKKEGYERRAYRMKIAMYPDGEPQNQYERDYTRFCRSFTKDVYNSNQELREIGQAWGIGLGDIQALYIDAAAILAAAERKASVKMSLFDQP